MYKSKAISDESIEFSRDDFFQLTIPLSLKVAYILVVMTIVCFSLYINSMFVNRRYTVGPTASGSASGRIRRVGRRRRRRSPPHAPSP